MWRARAVTFVNGEVVTPDGAAGSIRVRRGRVDRLGEGPARGDVVLDLDGAVVFAGLVNAHDHLELNSFPRLKWRPRYASAREWIADFQPRFGRDPDLALACPETLEDRLWVGGLKNLLSGVTTVCHHNPVHRPLRRRFPVRVVQRFGLSHSLHLDGPRVVEAYRRTPASWPWIIHAAEGVDADAGRDIDELDRLGCLGPNTVIVHGVGMDAARAARVVAQGGGLVWCPTSNAFLFGRTADVGGFAGARRLALGTDSRLSGEGDLLDELRAASATRQVPPRALVRAVTGDAARLLRLADGGRLRVGSAADLTIVRRTRADAADTLVASARRDVELTMIGGAPYVAAPRLAAVFGEDRAVRARVDGHERLLAGWIARRVRRLAIGEPGLEIAS
jgi:cytosine/adenosine deaminase-related metal-dependent hydrolase